MSGAKGAVLVTGCSSGIGEAAAIALCDRGFRVFAGVRREQDGGRIAERTAGRAVPVLLDVTDSGAIERAAHELAEATGEAGLAALVNNAGVTVAFPLEFLPIDELRRQIEVNLIGPVALAQATLPLLRKGRPGRIVNVSSVSGLIAAPYLGAYAASKHALEALTDSLRMEVAKFGVAVSLVEPADVDTPIWERSRAAADELRDRLSEQAAANAVPEEVREAYAADVTAMREAAQQLEKRAIPVGRVVRAVVHAVESRRPRTRYPVGVKAWAVRNFVRHLPDRLRDRVIRRSLGMK